jgi:hypothetical protein
MDRALQDLLDGKSFGDASPESGESPDGDEPVDDSKPQ